MECVSTEGYYAPKQGKNVGSHSSNLQSNLKKAIDTFCRNEASGEQFQSLAENVLKDLLELAAIDKGLSYNGWYESDDSIHTLLQKNQGVLLRVAEHINEYRSNFPPDLVKLAAQYCWETEHTPLTIKVPSFNYTFNENCSYYLYSTIYTQQKERALPHERTQNGPAWSLCLETTLTQNFMTESERDNLLHFFLKGSTNLDVDLSSKNWNYSDQYSRMTDCQKAETFHVFCDFLARHFEGNSARFYFSDAFIPLDTAIQALSFFFKNNPNATSLSFNFTDEIEPQIKPLCDLIENGICIKKLSLINCKITDEQVPALVTALNKRPEITEVDLSCNQLTLEGALELLKCKTITSLNLESNELIEGTFEKIAEALEKNYSLISLNLNRNRWRLISHNRCAFISPTASTLKIITELLERNQKLTTLRPMTIAYPSLQLALPQDVIQLILALGVEAKNISREKFNLPAL